MKVEFAEIEYGTPEYDQSIRLRDQLLRKPLGLEFKAEDLAEEWEQFHIVGYDEYQQMKSVLVFKPLDNEKLKMRQVAVLETEQGKGIGKKMVQFSEAWAKFRGYKHIELNAREIAFDFYLSIGYKKTGTAFEEVGIAHWKMVKKL